MLKYYKLKEKIMKKTIVFLSILSLLTLTAQGKPVDVSKIHGKIQYVDSFPDYKVEVVSAFSDLKVKEVTSFASNAGEWEIVTSFPDYKIQKVSSFGDFKIEYVNSFPGVQ
jgi:hypothetical protein